MEKRLDELTYDLGSYHFKRLEFAKAYGSFKQSPINGARHGKRLFKEVSSFALGGFLRQNFQKS